MQKIIKRYLTGGEKIIVLGLASIVFGIIFTSSAFAATMNTDVNIRPSMTLSVSTNDITLNLNPATKPFDSKDFSITIGTNNPSGYSLYLNADDTNLVNVDDSTKIIETLPSSTPASGYNQSSFPANYWGYRKSNGSTSSGNYFPYATNLLVSSASGPSNEITTSIGLASKIDYLKDSGTYKLNFSLNAIPTITQYYMQDLSDATLASQVCVTEHPTIVFDSRDDQAYTIQRLPDGRCWMTSNLLFRGTTLEPSDSNVTTTRVLNGGTYDGYSLKDNASTSSSNCYGSTSGGNGYSKACMYYVSSDSYVDGRPNAWYNYVAATAGTITGNSNSTEPTESICPRGWKIPSLTEANSIVSYKDQFNVDTGGAYVNGSSPNRGSLSSFFLSTVYNAYGRKAIYYVNGSLSTSYDYLYRRTGAYIRCILSE